MLIGALLVTGCLSWRTPRYPEGRPDKSYSFTVRDGDTYSSIAERLNLSVDELIAVNRARPPFTLRPGDTLLLPEPAFHIVGPNETLLSIARRYNVSHERLARRNDIRNPGQVYPGVKLAIPESARGAPTPIKKAAELGRWAPVDEPKRRRWFWRPEPVPEPAPEPAKARPADPPRRAPVAYTPGPRAALLLDWPARGRIISDYGDKGRGVFNDGINIALRTGTPIRAAADGIVIYRGNLVPGFGRLILVKHRNDIVTAYAHLDSYGVRENDRVRRGQIIGRSGSSGNVDSPQLHFEVRRGVRAVDPRPFLTGRT